MEKLKRVYCKAVDPAYVTETVDADLKGDYRIHDTEEPSWDKPANLIVSGPNHVGKHSPVLDIDIPVDLIESSTPGHYHLGFPSVEIDWDDYQYLLRALKKCGIIEPGYMGASIERGFTAVRTPDNKKPSRGEPIGFIQVLNSEGEVVDKPIYAPEPDELTKKHPITSIPKNRADYDTEPKYLGVAAIACEAKVLRYFAESGDVTTPPAVTLDHFDNHHGNYRVPGNYVPSYCHPIDMQEAVNYGAGGKLQLYSPEAYQWYNVHNTSEIDYQHFNGHRYLYRVPNKHNLTFKEIINLGYQTY